MYDNTKIAMMNPIDHERGTSKATQCISCAYSSSSLMPTHAMITNAPSTSAGYRLINPSNCPTTMRSATIPSMPPVRMTHVLLDIATATRMESIENARFIISTRTTVPQNADMPKLATAGGGPFAWPPWDALW